MVHGHVHHAVPQQKRPVPGEDTQIAAEHLFSRVHGWKHVRGDHTLHRDQIRGVKQLAQDQANLLSFHVRHRHREHTIRVQQRD